MGGHNPKSNPKTSRKRILVAERRRKLLELRKAGLSYAEIVEQHPELGYKRTSEAAQDGTRAINAILDQPARDVLALELSRLDSLTTAVWRAARTGDYRAVDRVLRVMERRAKLLGLDYAERNSSTEDADDARSMLQDLTDGLAKLHDGLAEGAPPDLGDLDGLDHDPDPEGPADNDD